MQCLVLSFLNWSNMKLVLVAGPTFPVTSACDSQLLLVDVTISWKIHVQKLICFYVSVRLFNCIFSGIVLSALFFKLAQFKICSSSWCSLSSHGCCCLLIDVTNSWRPGSLSVLNFLMSINGALCCQKKLKKKKKRKYIANATGTFFSSSVSSSNATGLKKPVVCNNFMIIW